MRTPESIQKEWLHESTELSSVEFYAEIQREAYNQAIDDAAINAECDIIYNPITSTTTLPPTIKFAQVSVESILKLKK